MTNASLDPNVLLDVTALTMRFGGLTAVDSVHHHSPAGLLNLNGYRKAQAVAIEKACLLLEMLILY